MTKVTSVRLSNAATAQLEALASTTKKTKTEIITDAILHYSNNHITLDNRVTALEYAVETLKDIIARTS